MTLEFINEILGMDISKYILKYGNMGMFFNHADSWFYSKENIPDTAETWKEISICLACGLSEEKIIKKLKINLTIYTCYSII